MIYRRNPQLFTANTPIFPQTYQNTLDRGAGRKLPSQNIWIGLIAGVLILWLVGSHLAWGSVSGDVSSLIHCVINGSKNCPAVVSK
jgi:hypothetical protein